MGFDLVAGDSGSKLVVVLKDSETDAAINLSGKTLKLRYQIEGAALQTRSMIVTDAVNGKAEYQFTASDLSAGTLVGEVRINEGQADQVTTVDRTILSVAAALV